MMFAASVAPAFLVQSAVIIVSAAVIAYLSYRLGLVPIVGFLLAGVVIGPHALGLVADPELVDAAAEVGVIFLLFTIGIEFSLEKLARIQRLIFGGGGLQVILSSTAIMLVLLPFGVGWRPGLFTGFLVSLSSTAIVLKLLADRGDTSSPYGQASLSLLIFQDLAIIVMVLALPMLAGTGGETGLQIAWALGKAVAIIAVVLIVARRLMPPVLERVALTCSPELFLLTVIAICFGTAWLTSIAGVSVSLGAFLGGLVVSESRFSHHAFGEIMPLQILFSATFFVSVGMLLDVRFLATHLPMVLAAVLLVLAVKVLTTGGSVLAVGIPAPVAAAVGLTLAQVGEFSFVLERAGREVGLSPAGLGDDGSQAFIAASVLLMVGTPQLAGIGARMAEEMERRRAKSDAANLAQGSEDGGDDTFAHLSDHVIVAGYGQAARQLVYVLHGSRIPFVITTLSPGGANEAEAAGLPVLRGDASRSHTLQLAGVERCRMVVVADDDPATALRIVAVARSLASHAKIVVRTRYQADAEVLVHDGTDRVIAEELESIVQLFAEVMRTYDLPAAQIESHEAAIRHDGYAALLAPSDEPVAICEFGDCPPGQPGQVGQVGRAGQVAQVGRAGQSVDTGATVTFAPRRGSACGHLGQIRPVRPSAVGCEECLALGDTWLHLRLCLTCGHVGCCDSSRNRHATAHHHATTHPIVRSLEPGESWGWCYVDEEML